MANKQKPKIILAMACQDIIRAKTAHAIACATIGDSNIIDFLMMQSCDISSARTWLVKQAIEKGATHLFFVDSDMTFPHDTIQRLLARDKDIIGVEYHKRVFPLVTVTAYLADEKKSETEPFKVGVAGTGVMLIKLALFDDPKLDKNWFSFGRNAAGEHVIGEDGWFCNTARAAGYDVWVDPSIKVGHLGEYAF